LAGSYVAAGDHTAEAIEAAETAHRLLPARTDVTANLLRVYLADGRRSDAAALAERAFAADPDAQRKALRVIARSDADRARRLIEEGRPEEALAALDQAEAVLAGRMTSWCAATSVAASSIVDAG
jgi:tetratricopeptide (TPR) repeat protein